MLKITDGEKTICAGPYLNEEGIAAAKTFLYEQIDEIDKYPDKSVFFQNPLIVEGWISMVRTLQEIKKWEVPEDDGQWEECAETYVAYLFELRAICDMYKDLYRAYNKHLWGLLEFYGGWLEGEYISFDGMEALRREKYEKDLKDVDDLPQYVVKLNKESHEARFAAYTILTDAYNLLMAIMNRGGNIVIALNPTEEDFAKAFDADLRIRTRLLKDKIFREMEEELARHYMENRTAGYTRQMWGKMQVADEEALKMAEKRILTKCDDPKHEHWGKAMKAKMVRYGKLMGTILSLIKYNELFDLGKPENVKPLIGLLGPGNLSLFYDIIIRRSLIQCEMFPELKAQYEIWLNNVSNNVNDQSESNNETEMDTARQSKLDEIIGILQKGDWKLPATADNVKLLLNTVFGKDTSLLDEGDIDKCADMWALVEGGGGERMLIVPSNLAGFFKEENLLKGSPKEISNALFSNGNQVNNINKGNPNHCSEAFKKVIPFLKKYIDKIIRQKKF